MAQISQVQAYADYAVVKNHDHQEHSLQMGFLLHSFYILHLTNDHNSSCKFCGNIFSIVVALQYACYGSIVFSQSGSIFALQL